MMIASKQDLQAYIKADRMSLGLSLPRGFFWGGDFAHYQGFNNSKHINV